MSRACAFPSIRRIDAFYGTIREVNIRAINLNLFTALDALLEERSVTRAARRAGLSQPAMSHNLAQLRSMLSDPLLVRGGLLTPLAESLRPRLRTGLAELQHVLEARQDFDPTVSQRVFRIAVSDAFQITSLHRLIAYTTAKAPQVNFVFRPPSPSGFEALATGALDLVVGSSEQTPGSARGHRSCIRSILCAWCARIIRTWARVSACHNFVVSLTLWSPPMKTPAMSIASSPVRASAGASRCVSRTMPALDTPSRARIWWLPCLPDLPRRSLTIYPCEPWRHRCACHAFRSCSVGTSASMPTQAIVGYVNVCRRLPWLPRPRTRFDPQPQRGMDGETALVYEGEAGGNESLEFELGNRPIRGDGSHE